jgi:hypothetical protein
MEGSRFLSFDHRLRHHFFQHWIKIPSIVRRLSVMILSIIPDSISKCPAPLRRSILQGELKLSVSRSNRWAGEMERMFGFYYVLKRDKCHD